ncbi:MAG: biopolymer transporter ExbB [Crocinitomicaceae bacterium]|jgi:biopolymer transport protein ExbB|nr:biopolymer transporter ExbB [Crocinitomicaceae bacterium]
MKKHIKFTVAAIALSAFGTFMLAQDSTQTAADPGKKIVGVTEISAFDFLIKGGVFLIPIALLLFYTIFLAVEKYLYIRRMAKHDKNLLSDIRTSLNSGNLDSALTIVSRDKTGFGSIVKEGIMTIGRPVSEIESNMEKVTNIEIAKMERNLGHLGLIAGIAPTLGFIGTISGVIKIFYSISITENVSIGNISAGLYEKMISSGSGLIVGIVAFAIYHMLNAIIDNFSLNAQKVNLDFVNIIQRPGHGDQTK